MSKSMPKQINKKKIPFPIQNGIFLCLFSFHPLNQPELMLMVRGICFWRQKEGLICSIKGSFICEHIELYAPE